jgi:hypothetical protein
MLLGADGKPITGMNAYASHLALQRMGIRSPDDDEFNDMIYNNTQVAEQMRKYGIWTSVLIDMEKTKGKGYKAKRIARPVIESRDGYYMLRGSEKPIKLPPTGWFTIRHLLQSEDGLPHETTERAPDEPASRWVISDDYGVVSVRRGMYRVDGQCQFDAYACFEPSLSVFTVGARGASDYKPNPVFLAAAEAVCSLENIGRKHSLKAAELLLVLSEELEKT